MGKIKQTLVPFEGTEKQKEQLLSELRKLKGVQGAMMPALQKAQDIYGYLPIEVQKIIAEVLNVSLEEVYGVVTFYSQFTMNPKGKYKVAVCMGTACYVKGAGDVLDELKLKLGIDAGSITSDSKFSLDATRCIGCCGLAPVITVNEDVYGKLSVKDVADIVKKYN